MERLSLKKKLLVIKLYFEGLSYDEIAARAGVSKGSIGNVIAELKAGKFPEYSDLTEQLDLLRELAIELKRTRITPVRAAVGVTVLTRLQELNVEPGDIQALSGLCSTLNNDGIDIPSFIKAALSFEAERERTGLGVVELEARVQELQESTDRLEPLAKEAAERQAQLDDLDAQCNSLTEEAVRLEDSNNTLSKTVRNLEQRETELANRVLDFEERSRRADEELTVARQDLKVLSAIGMSLDNLSAFAQRLKVIAQRHSIKPEVVCNKLMDELEHLDEGLGLDSIVKATEQELSRLEAAVAKAKETMTALTNTINKLKEERAGLKASLTEERRHITKDIRSINITAKETITRLKKDLSSGIRESIAEMNKLRDQALQLGEKVGHFDEIVESNKWLKGLLAMVKGEEGVEADQMRVILMTVTKAAIAWLDRHTEDTTALWIIRPSITRLIGDLERWKV